ncbi:hypothetical protein WKW80_09315 [Variovorax humicola]|uniref:Uncharacterized protein n=1 Tax=Variovorax humicola TaxID=1769758 RepID=A0ABU8VWQ1_9BURK
MKDHPMNETLFQLNGRLYPASIYYDLKSKQDARQAAHDAQFAKYNTEAGRAEARRAFMTNPEPQIVHVEAGGRSQAEIKGFDERRVDRIVAAVATSTIDKNGAHVYAIPAGNVYGRASATPGNAPLPPGMTPISFFGGLPKA